MAKKRATFAVSHPAQTVYRVIGPAVGITGKVADALENAREDRLAEDVAEHRPEDPWMANNCVCGREWPCSELPPS